MITRARKYAEAMSNNEIARQNAFLAAERANLAGLSYGVSAGRLGGGPATAGAPRPYPGRRTN